MTETVQRKQYFVNRQLQGKIVGRLAMYWVFYHLAIWLILFSFKMIPHIIGGLVNNDRPSFAEFCVNFVREQFFVLVVPVVLFPAIVWDMLRLTHKVAGPLVRFRNALRQLAAGQHVEKITLRPGDLLTEFQQVFNEFLASDRLRNDQTSKAITKSESNSHESAILDGVETLKAELRDARHQSCSTAIH